MIKYIVVMMDQRGMVPFMSIKPCDTEYEAEDAISKYHNAPANLMNQPVVLTVVKAFIPPIVQGPQNAVPAR